jgi:hypothetical protein
MANIKKEVLSVRLRPMTVLELDHAAEGLGYSRSDFIRKCIDIGLKTLFLPLIVPERTIKKQRKNYTSELSNAVELLPLGNK